MKQKSRKSAAALLALGMAALLGTGGIHVGAEAFGDAPEPACKAAYLMDYESGVQVYARNESKRLPIASMCKIMTLLLAIESAEAGELSYDEFITVSRRAAGMGGSQVFLGEGLEYRAEELLKSIAVCSANDACVAIAERISGSETAFLEKMNARAKELGADNTLFANCTGLPKDPQYSCAKDVAIMLRALLGHTKYYELTRVWLEDFSHPDGRITQMTNTNKLIRTYEGCDGGKTGFTNEAGFCMAATAKRGEMRAISVVIGADDSKKRFEDASQLLDYAFDNFESRPLLHDGQEIGQAAKVRGSAIESVRVAPERSYSVFCKRGESGGYSIEYKLDVLRAPVTPGKPAGCAVIYRDGVELGSVALVAIDEAKEFSWKEAYREGAKHWNTH